MLLLLEVEIAIRDRFPESFSQTFHRNDPLQQLIADGVFVRLELFIRHRLQLQTLLLHALHNRLRDLSADKLHITAASFSHRIALHDHQEPRAPRHIAEQGPHDVPHLPFGSQLVEKRFLDALREQAARVALFERELPVHAARVVGGLCVGNGELEDGATRRNRSNSHGTRDSIGKGNEGLGIRDDLEHTIAREIAHEEPFDTRSGEKLLLEGRNGEKGKRRSAGFGEGKSRGIGGTGIFLRWRKRWNEGNHG